MSSITSPARWWWSIDIPESIDGKPLAASAEALLEGGFPYDRLPSNQLVAASMRPEYVVAALVLYALATEPAMKQLRQFLQNNYGKSFESGLRLFVGVHNFVLAIFSGLAAYNFWVLSIQHMAENGISSAFCDLDKSDFWGAGGYGAWSVLFYFSKFYEFIDTFILVLKGKKPGLLQKYHHVGVILIAWGGMITQSGFMFMASCYNSFIHTLMYSYFFYKTLYPQAQIKSARFLTMFQMGQFILGPSIMAWHFFADTSSCIGPGADLVLQAGGVYTFGLLVLFAQFYMRKYTTKTTTKSSGKKKSS